MKPVFTRMQTSVEIKKQNKDSIIFPRDTGKFAEQHSSAVECCILTNNQCNPRLYATLCGRVF